MAWEPVSLEGFPECTILLNTAYSYNGSDMGVKSQWHVEVWPLTFFTTQWLRPDFQQLAGYFSLVSFFLSMARPWLYTILSRSVYNS